MLVCHEPAEPELEFFGCPAVGVGARHSEGYADELEEWTCVWCGARPFLPIRSCRERVPVWTWPQEDALMEHEGEREVVRAFLRSAFPASCEGRR